MELKQVTFSYNGKIDHLKQVNLKLAQGKITTIIGPNGSGKSTLLGVMSRNYQPDRGQVILDGKQLSQYTPKELARKIAIVHQHNEAPFDLTVEKLISYGRIPHQSFFAQSNQEDLDAVEWALECTNLQEKRKLTLDALSGGERQRVWIAMMLAQKTPFLFLDEPTTYLDIYYQLDILELVKKLNETYGITVVMVLHDINQALRYSDRLIVMKNGKIMLQGSPLEIMTEEAMKTIYGVDVVIKHDQETGVYMVPLSIHSATKPE